MNHQTAAALNRLNQRFYEHHAEEFSRTREDPWPGWDRALDLLPRRPTASSERLTVLDVGCGNGRFARFLDSRLGDALDYTGVDSSNELLEIAESRVARGRGRGMAEYSFLRTDLSDMRLGPLLSGRRFGLIVVYGVLHHLPGLARREVLLLDLAELLEPGGLLILNFWQFGELERFRQRMVSWEEYNRDAGEPIDPAQLESGDHLLAWGERAATVRYCHHASSSETESLVSGLGLERLDGFHADGAAGGNNFYVVLRRPRGAEEPRVVSTA